MIWLWLSTGFFALSFVLALRALPTGHRAPAPWRYGLMGAGFLCQCVFLFLRGREISQCPLTSRFEIVVFFCWSTVLLYFLIGNPFRLSLLGLFTAPLVAVLQLAALVAPWSREAVPSIPRPVEMWMELHAAVALVGFGAFALAFVAGIMFLIQDRQLKHGTVREWAHQLPPIQNLGTSIFRLLLFGLVLLSASIAMALLIDEMPNRPQKLWLTIAMWASYSLLIILRQVRGLPHRTVALAAVLCFALPVLTYWFLQRRSQTIEDADVASNPTAVATTPRKGGDK